MSFILDALKKSENERQRQSGPALFEVKVAPPRSRFPVWAVALGIVVGLNAVVVAWLLFRTPQTSQAVAAPSPQTLALQAGLAAPAAPPAQLPSAAAMPPRGAVPLPPQGATGTVLPASGAEATAVAGDGAALPSRAPPLLLDPEAEGELSDEALAARAAALAAEIPPEDAPAAAAPPAGARVVGPAGNAGVIPTREDLVLGGTQLPELRLDLHVFAAQPAERFVFINMRKLREGESLPDGVRVESITTEGAVLSFQGRRFLMPRE